MSDLDRFLSGDGSAGAPARLPEELLEIAREAGGGMIAVLLEVFQEDSMARLENLHCAIIAEDPDAIQSQAHSLKGSASQIGAVTLSGLCRQMERLSKTGTPLERKALYEEIDGTLRRVIARIPSFQAIVAGTGNGS